MPLLNVEIWHRGQVEIKHRGLFIFIDKCMFHNAFQLNAQPDSVPTAEAVPPCPPDKIGEVFYNPSSLDRLNALQS